MDATIHFYEKLLGFTRVVESQTRIKSGGTIREVYFDVGEGQFIVFMEPKEVPGIPADYDTGINGALGVPRGMYHYALRVPTIDDLDARRTTLESHGVEVSAIIDLGHAKSVFFFDPNGIQLEFCWQTRPFNESDLHRESEANIASSS
jgi:catechol 2,3-dioxygenase-like lactoylglutathione lyase family enzyme